MIRAVYEAGPIDAVSLEEARDWQDYLASLCPDIMFFSPAHPYRNVSIENADIIDGINREAIDWCGCVVAYLPEGRPAFGTLREIEFSARTRGYPTVVISSNLKSLLRYDLTVVATLEEAAEWFNDQNVSPRGIKPLGDIAPIYDIQKYPSIKKCRRGPSYNHWPHIWEAGDLWCPGDLVELG